MHGGMWCDLRCGAMLNAVMRCGVMLLPCGGVMWNASVWCRMQL